MGKSLQTTLYFWSLQSAIEKNNRSKRNYIIETEIENNNNNLQNQETRIESLGELVSSLEILVENSDASKVIELENQLSSLNELISSNSTRLGTIEENFDVTKITQIEQKIETNEQKLTTHDDTLLSLNDLIITNSNNLNTITAQIEANSLNLATNTVEDDLFRQNFVSTSDL